LVGEGRKARAREGARESCLLGISSSSRYDETFRRPRLTEYAIWLNLAPATEVEGVPLSSWERAWSDWKREEEGENEGQLGSRPKALKARAGRRRREPSAWTYLLVDSSSLERSSRGVGELRGGVMGSRGKRKRRRMKGELGFDRRLSLPLALVVRVQVREDIPEFPRAQPWKPGEIQSC